MKKLFILPLIIFGLSFSGFSQNNLLRIDRSRILPPFGQIYTDFTSRTYDENRNIIYEHFENLINSFVIFEENLLILSDEYRTFDEDNQLTSSFLTQEFSSGVYQSNQFYTYNENCLVLQESNYFRGEIPTSRNISYFNTNTCQKDSVEYYEFAAPLIFEKIYVYRYTYETDNDNNLVETCLQFEKDSNGGFTQHLKTGIVTTNPEGLIIRSWTKRYFNSGSYNLHMKVMEYDSYRNITYCGSFEDTSNNGNDSLVVDWERYYNNQYDDNDQLSEVLLEHISPNLEWSSTKSYQYFCDQLLKEDNTAYADGTEFIQTYTYEDGYDCATVEGENLLQIFPSFTHSIVNIESEILKLENTYIELYDMAGHRLISKKANRINTYSLDLSNLPSGHYIIRVINENHNESARLVKI